jgi:hypothetical protein
MSSPPIPWTVPADLPDPQDIEGRIAQRVSVEREREAERAEQVEQVLTEDNSVRTALAVEPRDGKLCVFMPPTERLEDYLELLTATEATAKELGLTVHVEGYPPPTDPRLNVIKVTPDPGVIEVNVHPAASWRECVAITRGLYEEARLARLGTEKFMLDGRHTGTGGGNHVVVGGAQPADSPFLRRPDLLKSLVLYWQRHPSLSYLFSGLFIGPTSQAPRVDEARHDGLYELEIAMAMVPKPGEGEAPPPWLVDRLFRNLLVDSTGNTHRTELCIDKLFSPDGPSGTARARRVPRLRDAAGRAHEPRPAAPHPRPRRLVLEGAAGRAAGALGHRPARPVHAAAFRLGGFPRRARRPRPRRLCLRPRLVRGAVRVPLPPGRPGRPCRRAHGDQPGAGALARARRGRGDRRHRALRRFLRRAPAGAPHGPPAGAPHGDLQRPPRAADRHRPHRRIRRRRALQGLAAALGPASDHSGPCPADLRRGRHLEPAVHGRLRLSRRPPGGRNYDTFPVNAYEAEARRRARFQDHGHTPGLVDPPRAERSGEFPATLDLRRPPVH